MTFHNFKSRNVSFDILCSFLVMKGDFCVFSSFNSCKVSFGIFV